MNFMVPMLKYNSNSTSILLLFFFSSKIYFFSNCCRRRHRRCFILLFAYRREVAEGSISRCFLFKQITSTSTCFFFYLFFSTYCLVFMRFLSFSLFLANTLTRLTIRCASIHTYFSSFFVYTSMCIYIE